MTCAAQPGTTFVIEDLYFNLEQRRKVSQSSRPFLPLYLSTCHITVSRFPPVQALGSAAEEYSKILDLVGKYAVSRPEVAFSCKKQVWQGVSYPLLPPPLTLDMAP